MCKRSPTSPPSGFHCFTPVAAANVSVVVAVAGTSSTFVEFGINSTDFSSVKVFSGLKSATLFKSKTLWLSGAAEKRQSCGVHAGLESFNNMFESLCYLSLVSKDDIA